MRIFRLTDPSEEEIQAGVPPVLILQRMKKYQKEIAAYFDTPLENLTSVDGEDIYAACNGLTREQVDILPMDQIGKWLTEELGA